MRKAETVPEGRAVGYVRVSTVKQDHDSQMEAIRAAAKGAGLRVKFVEETVSSRKAERQIYSVVEGMAKGETLIVFELSRLARSIGEVFELVQAIKRRGGALWVLKPEIKIGSGVNGLQGDMLLFALGVAAQVERDLISERTKNALQERKRKGVKLGRPEGRGLKVATAIEERGMSETEIRGYLEGGVMTTAGVARMLGMDPRTVREWVRTGGEPARKGNAKRA